MPEFIPRILCYTALTTTTLVPLKLNCTITIFKVKMFYELTLKIVLNMRKFIDFLLKSVTYVVNGMCSKSLFVLIAALAHTI